MSFSLIIFSPSCCKVKPRKVVLQTTKLNPAIHHHFIQHGVSRQLNCHFPLNFYWLLNYPATTRAWQWMVHENAGVAVSCVWHKHTRSSLMNGQFCLDDDREPPLHIFPWTALFGLFALICALHIGCVIVICSPFRWVLFPSCECPFKVRISPWISPFCFLTVYVIIS